MGQLLDVRDFVEYVDANKGQKSEKAMYKDYASAKDPGGDDEWAKQLLEKAKKLGVLTETRADILGTNRDTVVLALPDGKDFLRKHWRMPTGVWKEYTKENAGWLSLALAFISVIIISNIEELIKFTRWLF